MKYSSPLVRWDIRSIHLAALLVLPLAAVVSCSGSTGTGPAPTFWASGTPATPNQVRLASGSASSGTLTILVQLVGPTTDDDVSGFSFDLLLSDPAVADYVDGSATVGTALGSAGGSNVSVQIVHDEQRVSVVVRRQDGSGDGVASGQATVLALRYTVHGPGTTAVQFAPDPAPEAVDSRGVRVASIAYDMVPSAIVGH